MTDMHRSYSSRPEQQRWWPKHIANWPLERQMAYLNYWDKLTTKAFDLLLDQAKARGPYDFLLSLGDNTSGDDESGLLTPEAQGQFQNTQSILRDNFSGSKMLFAQGGHDCGYNRARNLETVSQGFKKANELLGPSWQSVKIGEFTLIILNSEKLLAVARYPEPIRRNLMMGQINFLASELQQTNGNIIMAIHNPAALNLLGSTLKYNCQKIVLTLAGHLHLKFFNYPFYLVPLYRYIRTRIVPSPWGLATPWGAIGTGGFCVLVLKDNHFRLQYHSL
ncbi:MAG: hypothetical protein Q8M83_00965 [bacterium]|nr:hypothetical protein [bacterium]